MYMDIFSGFDDHNGVFIDMYIFVWLGVLLVFLSLFTMFWSSFNGLFVVFSLFVGVVEGLVSRSEGKNIGSSVSFFSVLFMLLVVLNLFGLFPYVFRLTRHLAVNLALSLPI